MGTKRGLMALMAIAPLLMGQAADRAGGYPHTYPQIVESYLERALRDPGSAVVKATRGPRLGEWRELKAFGHTPRMDAYFVCYTINAKNLYGAYTGAQDYMFVIAYGAVQASRHSPYFNEYAGRETEDSSLVAECGRLADPPPPPPSN